MFGIPEDTPGNTDTKILSLCNKNLGLEPPLVLDDLEVTHRVSRPPAVPNPNDDSAQSPPKPRPILVKFASKRVKGRVMDERSTLKDNPLKLDNGNTVKIYIQGDLTKRRANLAYRARQLKNAKKILVSWVSNCKILVKDNYNRITLVNDTQDLLKFENAQSAPLQAVQIKISTQCTIYRAHKSFCGFLLPLPFVTCISRCMFVQLIPNCYLVYRKWNLYCLLWDITCDYCC